MPLMLYFATSGAFLFGYAKPVPVNFGHLRHPKRDMIWVALAGPGVQLHPGHRSGRSLLHGAGRHRASTSASSCEMAKAGVLVNLVMWAFNLFPLPPLDGGRVLVGLLPRAPGVLAVAASSPGASSSCWAWCCVGVVGTFWLRPLIALGYCGARPPAHAPDLPAPLTAMTAPAPLPHRHHHHRHAAPGQLRRRDPPRRAGQPPRRHRELLLPGRLPRADQVRRAGAHPALDAGDRRLLAGRGPGPGAGLLLPPVRHPRDPRADLAAHLRHRQGPAQPRPRLQGVRWTRTPPPAWTRTPTSPRACSCTRC